MCNCPLDEHLLLLIEGPPDSNSQLPLFSKRLTKLIGRQVSINSYSLAFLKWSDTMVCGQRLTKLTGRQVSIIVIV